MTINKAALGMQKRRILSDIAILLGDGKPADITSERISAALVLPLEATVIYEGLKYHKKHRPYLDPKQEAALPKGNGRSFGTGFSPKEKIKLSEYANWMLHGFTSTPEYRGFVVQATPILNDRYFSNEIYVNLPAKAGGPLLIIPPYPGIPGSFYWLIINRVKSWWKIT